MKETTQKLLRLQREGNLANLFRLICENGDKIVAEYLVDGRVEKMTYREFESLTRQIAYRLSCLLGAPGRYVGIHLDNCPQWTCMFWGLLMAGYKPVLLDFRARRETLLHLLRQSRAVAIITREEGPIEEGVARYGPADILDALPQVPPDWQPSWADRIALCTSGTTATSKIFVYDEAALISTLGGGWMSCEESIHLGDSGTKILAFLPFYHIFGLFTVGLWPLIFGNTVVYLKDRSPATLLDTCRRLRVSHVYAVPLLWNNLAAKIRSKIEESGRPRRMLFSLLGTISLAIQRLSPRRGAHFCYRFLFKNVHKNLLGPGITMSASGGAAIAPATMRLLSSLGFIIVSGYGMTEAGIVSIDSGTSFSRRMGRALGKPFTEVEVKIAGEAGEVRLRGRSLHSARLEDGREVPPSLDGEGWFATGDLGRIENGILYLDGRCKDTIVKETGEKVYPDELEDFFRGLPGAEGISVLGLRQPDGGDATTLVVYAGRGTPDSSTRLAEEIQKVNRRLPVYKRLDQALLSLDPLPATTSMKIQRQKLQQLLEQKAWQIRPIPISRKERPARRSDMGAQAPQVREEVRAIFARVLGKSPGEIGDEDHFLDDLGGDSLQAIELANAVERKFTVFIPDSVLLECTNVREISDAVSARLNGGGNRDQLQAVAKSAKTPVRNFEDTREYQAFARRMEQVGELNPYFSCHDSIVRDTSFLDGREVINMGSYNYLGLSGHPEVMRAAQDAVERYGTSASGSRLLTGDKGIYRRLERELAEWKQVEDAIILVSGHATNVTFVGNFCTENDLILYDALSHNSIEQGCRLSRSDSKAFPHNDIAALENILAQNRDYYEKVLLVAEGVYSMDGDIAPVPEMVEIKNRYGVFLMVDEAHSTCVLGQNGKGVDEHFGLSPEDIDIRMGTLSKGLGSCGGYLAGKKSLIEYLRYHLPGFVFSVGIPPASAAAALAAIKMIKDGPERVARLHANIRIFIEDARRRDLHTCLAGETAIIPILIGDESSAFVLSNAMRQCDVFVPPAVYPAVARGKARLRFCVTSEHSADQISFALDTLQSCAHQHSISLPRQSHLVATA